MRAETASCRMIVVNFDSCLLISGLFFPLPRVNLSTTRGDVMSMTVNLMRLTVRVNM